MALPTKDKTWQFDVNIFYTDDDLASRSDTNKGFLLALKNALVGFASSPWAVESCSNSVAVGNNDGVDRWASGSDLVWGTTGNPHSWIVLTQPALGNGSICIALDSTTGVDSQGSIIFSPSAGFGAANGGADGTTTARPTATDEHVVIGTGNIVPQTSGGVTNQSLHVWLSSDGACTRAVATRGGNVQFALFFDAPKNPITAWSPARVYTWTRGNTLLYGNFFTTSMFHFTQGGVGQGLFEIAMAGADNSTHGRDNEASRFPNEFSGRTIMAPAVLYSDTVGLEGAWGLLHDVYGAPDTLPLGSTIRDQSGAAAWMKVGDLWLPWSPTLGAIATG